MLMFLKTSVWCFFENIGLTSKFLYCYVNTVQCKKSIVKAISDHDDTKSTMAVVIVAI